MNKKIKCIMAITLSILGFSAFEPSQHSVMTTKAYAATATYALANNGELKSLEVKSTDGKSLDLCDDYDGYKQSLTDEKTYYVTLDSNSDGVKIMAESAGDGYVVKVFESDRKNATAHDLGENMSLKKGINTLWIRTFTSEEAFKRAVKKDDITNCDKTYKININKASINGADDIYIEKLTLNSGEVPINFNKDVLEYNISVDEDEYELTIKVKPEDEDYTLKIDGMKTTGDDDYKRSLALKKGKNEIKINISDVADNTRTYTLNVNRGSSLISSTNTTPSVSTIGNSQATKANQWVQVNSKWQYNDSTGTSLKNIWFYDKNLGKSYYFQADGNMGIDWLNDNGKWYYLGTDGAMKTGWQLVSGTWYYLDSQGVMAKNTTIDGFKLGNDGAWVK